MADITGINPPIRLQPSLGRVKDNYKPEQNIGGYIALAKVTKVHHKNYTVDVQLITSKDVITSSDANEGRFAARVTTSSASYNAVSMSTSGVVEPLQEGELVVLAFLDSSITEPIILGSFHNTFKDEYSILTDLYPIDPNNSLEEFREAMKYLRVYPSQAYHKVDGVGAMEFSLPSKSFLKIDPDIDKVIDDSHGGFDHEDLSEKDPLTGETYSGKDETASLPIELLFSHRSGGYTNSGPEGITEVPANWTKFFLDSYGMFRITRDNNDKKLTYQQVSDDGSITFRRQLDSDVHGSGTNFLDLTISTEGRLLITRTTESNKTSTISMTEEGEIGISQSSGSSLYMDNLGGVDLVAEDNLNLSGKLVSGYISIGPTPPENPKNGALWYDTGEV